MAKVINCLFLGTMIALAMVTNATADPRVFTAKDFSFYDAALQKWSSVIIKGVNEVAHNNTECIEADPMSADFTDKGTPQNPIFFVACKNAEGRFFNATFSADNVRKQKGFGRTFPIQETEALRICEASVRSRAAHPSTLDFSRYWNAVFAAFPNGRTRFETKFSARNSFNLKITFKVSCFFEGRRLTATDISESGR